MSETKGDYYPRMNALLQEEEIQRLQAQVNLLRTENAELKARLAQHEQGQPMETAPRDGSKVLLRYDGQYYDIGKWNSGWDCVSEYFSVNDEDFDRWWPLPGGAK